MNKTQRPDKRKFNNLKKSIRKAENRINAKIWKKMLELSKDKKFMESIDNELKMLKSEAEFQDYIANANKLAAEENDKFLNGDSK